MSILSVCACLDAVSHPVGLTALAIGAIAKTYAKGFFEDAANKAFDKDIANGTLVTRYKEEVLKPKLQQTEKLAEGLRSQLSRQTSKTDFDNAAAADASPAAKVPAKKRRYFPQLKH